MICIEGDSLSDRPKLGVADKLANRMLDEGIVAVGDGNTLVESRMSILASMLNENVLVGETTICIIEVMPSKSIKLLINSGPAVVSAINSGASETNFDDLETVKLAVDKSTLSEAIAVISDDGIGLISSAELRLVVDDLKATVDGLKTEVVACARAELRAVVDGLRAKLRAGVDGLRAKLRAGVDGLRAKLRAVVDGFRAELIVDCFKAAVAELKTEVEGCITVVVCGNTIVELVFEIPASGLLEVDIICIILEVASLLTDDVVSVLDMVGVIILPFSS